MFSLKVEVPCSPAPDFLFTWVSEVLIQEHVLKVFQQEGLTGYWTAPATGRMKKTGIDLQVLEFGVEGWGGKAPLGSGIHEVERCLECGLLRYSSLAREEYLIDTNNWDGSDFFMIWPLPRFIFVTQRVVDVFKKHRITGARFVKEFPKTGDSGFGPGRLSYWMPEARAHQLGDPLDIF